MCPFVLGYAYLIRSTKHISLVWLQHTSKDTKKGEDITPGEIIRLTETVAWRTISQIATRMSAEVCYQSWKRIRSSWLHALEVWRCNFWLFVFVLEWGTMGTSSNSRSIKSTRKLQMLLRGQNPIRIPWYADVVRLFVEKSVQKRNRHYSCIRAFKRVHGWRIYRNNKISEAGHCQTAISYTTSPVHTVDYYVDLVGRMAEFGADSICIKGMAGSSNTSNGLRISKSYWEKLIFL